MQIGIVGLGFMGATHFRAVQKLSDAKVGAICTRDRAKLAGDWRGIKGNFGDAGGMQDLSGVRMYESLEAMLADDALDIIDVCLPTDLHRPVTEAALRAGKHVLVEKPIASTVTDADAMIKTSEQCRRKLFVGQVLRFYPEFRLVWDMVQSGELGALKALHLKRMICKSNDLAGLAHRGGAILDLHIHDADFVQMLLGMPREVYATGLVVSDYPTHVSATYVYDQAVNVSVVTGYSAVPTIKFEHGYAAYFENGTLQFSSLTGGGPVLWLRDVPDPITPEMGEPDPFKAQLQYVVDACAGKHDGRLLSGQSARDSLLLVEKVTESVHSGRPVRIR